MRNRTTILAKQAAVCMQLLLSMTILHASAQTSNSQTGRSAQQETELQQLIEQLQNQTENGPRPEQSPHDELWQQGEKISGKDFLPPETLCSQINEFRIELPDQLSPAQQRLGASNAPDDPFFFLRQSLDTYRGQCIGRDGINLITHRMAALLYSQGYSTTRLEVPLQDLSEGSLRILLIPGVIRSVSFSAPDISGDWKIAFASRPGDLLNLNNLEQGLEQLKRLYSRDVDMQLIPGDRDGESDIVIDVRDDGADDVLLTSIENERKDSGQTKTDIDQAIGQPLRSIHAGNAGFNIDSDRRHWQHGTVRRLFKGELTPTAEQGFFSTRSEIDVPLGRSRQSLYAGVDIGKLYGLQYLLSDKLAGAALGVRGGGIGFNYDMFLGWALYKPQNFRGSTQAVGLNLLINIDPGSVFSCHGCR